MPSGTAAEIELANRRSTSENAEEIQLTIGSRFPFEFARTSRVAVDRFARAKLVAPSDATRSSVLIYFSYSKRMVTAHRSVWTKSGPFSPTPLPCAVFVAVLFDAAANHRPRVLLPRD
jgi:hypothetical protein